MEFGLFTTHRNSLTHQHLIHFRQRAKTTAIAVFVLATLTNCVSDQRSQIESPRDLVRDSSVQADRFSGSARTKIGVLLPLSGPHADIGHELWDAAVLSLFESGRDDIVLEPHDTHATPAGAAKAAESAVADGDNVVIGPLFSSSVSAARPTLAAHGIRGIALSNNRAEARAPFFLIGSHPETQVDAIVSYLNSEGRRRIKLFGPDTPYLALLRERLVLLDKAGKIQLIDTRLYRTSASYTEIAKDVRAVTLYDQRVKALKDFTAIFANAWQQFEDPEEALKAALEKLTSRMEQARLHFASYAPEARPDRKRWAVTEAEYGEALSAFLQIYHRQLKAKEMPQQAMAEAVKEFELRETLGKADFDAILLPIGDKPLLVIAPMFEYFNASQPDVWLMGTDIWESAAAHGPKDLIGSRYVAAAAPGWAGFQSRFEDTFGRRPERLAAAAYDAVKVAVIEKNETGRTVFDASFLTRPQGFEGVIGTFRFLPDGSNERALQIVEVRKDGSVKAFTWNPEQQNAGQEPMPLADPGKATPPLPPVQRQPTPPLSAVNMPGADRT